MPATGDRITKSKDRRFVAHYSIHTPDGPKRNVIYGTKYKEVEKKLAEARGVEPHELMKGDNHG